MRMSDWSSDVCSSDLSTPQAIDALHRSGVRVVMLTGDSKATARAVAEQLGIDEAIGEVMPEDKRDRKSVVEGKSVSVRVELGGRRHIQKKKHKKLIEA